MKRSIILPALVTAFVALSPAGVALAENPHNTTNNPNSTGQPNQNAELEPSQPAGFGTGAPGTVNEGKGFANAQTHYADMNGGNPKAVSQYDVAAFQLSNNHGHTR